MGPSNELAYMHWLYEQLGSKGSNEEEYGDLCYWLYHQKFYSILPNDDNRAEDGLQLRTQFGIQLDLDCSMLEFLIALAMRMDYILHDPRYINRIGKWFWMLVDNLGLDPVDVNEPRSHTRNQVIVQRFLERRYNTSGRGGLFPLKRGLKDQRKVEIWYQMMDYISQENL